MYTTTSKQQEGCTFKDSHPKCFITTNFDKFHRDAFARAVNRGDVLTACFRDIQSQRHSTKHGLDWTGQLDWTAGLDSWTGQLDWTIGLEFFSIKYMQFDVFEENEMIIFKLLCFFL